jgi:hypothetical protein
VPGCRAGRISPARGRTEVHVSSIPLDPPGLGTARGWLTGGVRVPVSRPNLPLAIISISDTKALFSMTMIRGRIIRRWRRRREAREGIQNEMLYGMVYSTNDTVNVHLELSPVIMPYIVIPIDLVFLIALSRGLPIAQIHTSRLLLSPCLTRSSHPRHSPTAHSPVNTFFKTLV